MDIFDLGALTSSPFPEIKKKLGFGCMRLPMEDGEIDLKQFSAMVDAFMRMGFNYFDTAHGYHSGKSEPALRAALTSRYPRESYVLTDKLSGDFFSSRSDIRPLFEQQLTDCGVDYFDFYLMHALSARNYDQYQRCHAFETAQKLLAEGKIHHLGISFHDSPEMLERILKDHPEIEVVQLQFNYADFDDPEVRSGACYRVCVRYGVPVIAMEPVKGGALAGGLPAEAVEVFKELKGGTPASYALRFVLSHPQVCMVLSGMSNLPMTMDNLSTMLQARPLAPNERAAIDKVKQILIAQNAVPCTACGYCLDNCPARIPIPELFSCYNLKQRRPDWDGRERYAARTAGRGKASDCVKCGKCEHSCPQHLPIRDLLIQVADTFEN